MSPARSRFRASPFTLASLAVPLLFCAACAGSSRGAAPAEGRVPAAGNPVTLRELRVRVPAGGGDPEALLACTLVTPNGSGRSAGVLMLPGTGPARRDFHPEDLRLDLPRRLALRMAVAGVASLRCDTRGVGESSGRFWDGTQQTYVRDAEAMLGALREAPEIDPARAGIIGPSEGGITAKIVAEKHPEVRALVLMAAGESDFRQAVIDGQAADAKRRGAGEQEVARIRAMTAEALDDVGAGRPLPQSVPPELQTELKEKTAWLRSRLASDTRAMTRLLRPLPILILQGDGDWVVPPSDAQLLRDDLRAGHNPSPRFVVYPRLNHHFADAAGDLFPAGPIAEAPLDDVAEFLEATL